MSTKRSPLPIQPSASNGSAPNQQHQKAPQNLKSKTTSLMEMPATERKTSPTTRITIHYDVGFSNAIYLRGKGGSLSWDKGVLLKNTKTNEWVWETATPFTTCEFKVLINDKEYEIGDNHLLSCGASIHYTPKFH